MWHALRAELAYLRVYLLSALAIALCVAVMVDVLIVLTDDSGEQGYVLAGLPGLFMIIAALVVGFIGQGLRSEERRIRLLLAGPLTPRQLAGVMVLLPACLFGLGAVGAGLVVVVAYLVTGRLELAALSMVGGVMGQLFATVQLGPLAQEATAARRQQRFRPAMIGWTIFVVAILVLLACQWHRESIYGHLGELTIAVAVMAVSAALFANRTDFTR